MKARKARNPLWHREAVGGLWAEIGVLQFQFLLNQGLQPNHYLLDIGCGSLRGGLHFIRFLEAGHYFGVDIDGKLLDAGRQEAIESGLVHKCPQLLEMGEFTFEDFDRKFHYALAQSVFTHLTLNGIVRCLMNVERVLLPEGRFYATFFENPSGKFNLEPISHLRADGPAFDSHIDKDPYHYDFDTFKWVCQGTDLRVEYIGKWDHPRDQRMLVFVKSAARNK